MDTIREQINHPDHYGGKDNPYEAIKIIEALGLGFCLGNTLKYIARAGKKEDRLRDLKKAMWYLNREISNIESKDFPDIEDGEREIEYMDVSVPSPFLKWPNYMSMEKGDMIDNTKLTSKLGFRPKRGMTIQAAHWVFPLTLMRKAKYISDDSEDIMDVWEATNKGQKYFISSLMDVFELTNKDALHHPINAYEITERDAIQLQWPKLAVFKKGTKVDGVELQTDEFVRLRVGMIIDFNWRKRKLTLIGLSQIREGDTEREWMAEDEDGRWLMSSSFSLTSCSV